MTRNSAFPSCILVVLITALTLCAQPPAETNPPVPAIADEPKTIDPTALLPAKLAAKATRDFSDSSLREIVAWLQAEQGLVVLLDKNALADIGVSAAEPVSDRLLEEPIYLLLNRLRFLGLDWYYDDEILYITSQEAAAERAATLPYNVVELLDAGYDLDMLENVITNTLAPDAWEAVGGEGVVSSLGDVLFVRQNDNLQREVQALLQALAKPARQTFLNDPSQHLALRGKLQESVSANFEDTPLETAVQRLADTAQIDIRLDLPALRSVRVRQREPVTLKLADRKLETVLQAIILDLNLTWIIRDGVLWITSFEEAENHLKTAVYDVRDLCRDADESRALIDAITSQAEPSSWAEVGGRGNIEYAKPGMLVIAHREQMHQKVLQLLETYRTALRSSKPRQRDADDSDEVTTVYYRLHANIARDLASALPLLVRPESWRTVERPEAPGTILIVSSVPELSAAGDAAKRASAGNDAFAALLVERAVLIVQQTRAAHDEIAKVIERVESGDAPLPGGFGGGGFGGGFFSVPAAPASKSAE